MKKNEFVIGKCIDYDYQGLGIVKIDGFVVFVKGLIKDEVANIKIIKVLKNSAVGIIDELIKPSVNRVKPLCSVYKTCGGCALMHMNYQAQIDFKYHYVQSLFNQAKINIQVNPVKESLNPTHYRNKVQIPLQYDQKWKCGFYRNHSHDLVEFDQCMIQNEFANVFAIRFVQLLNTTSLKEGVRHLVLRIMDSQIMVIVVVSKMLEDAINQQIIALCKEFKVTSLYYNLHPCNDNVVLTYNNQLMYGQETIQANCLGLNYVISANSFYQVNSVMMEVLYQTAYDYMQVKPSDTILDLYCGTGTIGLGVAKKCHQVMGVDIVESSIENAKVNARINQIDNATFVCMDAGQAATQLVNEGKYFDGIFVDPPRKGCDETTIDALKSFAPKRIVYISCNPATLARDCVRLNDMYTVESVTPVDMFAHSHHVECIALIQRRKW